MSTHQSWLFSAVALAGLSVTAFVVLALPLAPPNAGDKAAVPAAPTKFDVHGDPLPSCAISRMGTVRFRHGGRITQVAFSPNGKILYSASPDDKLVRSWEIATGRELRQFGDKAGIWYVVVSPDGQTLVTGDDKNELRVWDIANGHVQRNLALKTKTEKNRDERPGPIVARLRLSRDGKTLVSSHLQEHTLIVWDLPGGKELQRIPADNLVGHAFDLSADGKTLVAASGNSLGVWDVASGKQRRQLQGHTQIVVGCALSPDGKTAVSFGLDQALRWWDVGAGKELDAEELSSTSASMTFSPDGKTLAITHDDAEEGGAVSLYDVATREESVTLDDFLPGIHALAYSPDGKILATGSGGSSGDAAAIRLWDVETGKEMRPLAAHPGAVTTIAITADGKLAASCSASERIVRLWDVATGREVKRLEGHETGVDEVQFSPDGKWLASAAWEQPIILWDVATGKQVRQLADHATLGPHMRFSMDSKTLATAGRKPTAGIWDVATGKLLQEFAQPPNGVAAVVGYADGRLLVYEQVESENDNEVAIALWDLVAGRVVRRFSGHRGMVNCAVLSPDGRMVATKCEDQLIRVWEVATGAERVKFTDPGADDRWTGTQFLAFAPDCRALASCGPTENVVRLWDLTTGKPLTSLAGHRGWVGALEFSADGRVLISSSQDTSTIAWDLHALTGKREQVAARRSDVELRKRWDDLGERDATQANRALWDLAAVGDQAVTFLRGQMRAVVTVDPQQIARWIAELDHPLFATRERATTALTHCADQSELALRTALVRTKSAEVSQRIRRILDAGSATEPNAERLRETRAVEVLERIGTTAARKFLDELGRGAPGATLTREAQAAMKRLSARAAPVSSQP